MSEISIDQQFLLTSNDFVKSRSFWIQYMETSSPDKAVSLVESCKPCDGKRSFSFTLEPAVAKKLMALCKNNELSAYIYIVAAYNVLHYKYTGANSVGVASPLFSKSFGELPYTYNELLPVVCAVNSTGSFKELLMQVRNNVLDIAKHQH
ncbi:MAG: condensation domain-containing protein, partial [Chitinophagaceae bacterium]